MTILALLLSLAASCAVVVPHGHSGSSASYASRHPHGGPPGQAKKGKVRHHGHGPSCGHSRKKHDGVWIYFVDGAWYRPSATGWVVVRI